MKIVDVNVLIYACNSASDHHATVRRWWESALNGDESVGLAWSTIVGFLRMTTSTRVFERPLSISTVLEQIDGWLALPNLSLVAEKSDHWILYRELIETHGLRGNLMPDAHLAALSIGYGATLVSCDNDFRRFANLRWENPLQTA